MENKAIRWQQKKDRKQGAGGLEEMISSKERLEDAMGAEHRNIQ